MTLTIPTLRISLAHITPSAAETAEDYHTLDCEAKARDRAVSGGDRGDLPARSMLSQKRGDCQHDKVTLIQKGKLWKTRKIELTRANTNQKQMRIFISRVYTLIGNLSTVGQECIKTIKENLARPYWSLMRSIV